MTKYRNIILAVIIFMITFLIKWYGDELFDMLFIFIIILWLIILISNIWFLTYILRESVTQTNYFDFIALGISFFTIAVTLAFPFRSIKTKLELNLYDNKRNQIIDMIKSEELKPDDLGNVELPKNLKKVSMSGEVYIFQNTEEGQVIGFWIFRGMQSGSVQLIYSSEDEKLIRKNETGHPIMSIEKLKEHWYYVITDY